MTVTLVHGRIVYDVESSWAWWGKKYMEEGLVGV